ncbi:hypothetical protein BDV96DRAFT_657969 [Lophiotrema nucula]|uniref:Uncharacterized protein n=1 Tax=Lophiotrema nucula TaxID=690887 RepID=A0A6A5ZCT9_9PLEO|nr:hypothetical protein BDV96DRAFT_657969 [Lophiotrema nucula]
MTSPSIPQWDAINIPNLAFLSIPQWTAVNRPRVDEGDYSPTEPQAPESVPIKQASDDEQTGLLTPIENKPWIFPIVDAEKQRIKLRITGWNQVVPEPVAVKQDPVEEQTSLPSPVGNKPWIYPLVDTEKQRIKLRITGWNQVAPQQTPKQKSRSRGGKAVAAANLKQPARVQKRQGPTEAQREYSEYARQTHIKLVLARLEEIRAERAKNGQSSTGQ